MSSWTTFWESWPLFADSVLAGTIAGAVLGFVGVYIVLRKMVFLSAALSQVAGFGVTLAFLAQISLGVSALFLSPSIGAMLASFAVVLLLMSRRAADDRGRDAFLGIAFLVGSAGTLMVGTRIVQELQDVESLLFGTAVAVLPEDFTELAVIAGLVALLHIWWRRGFTAISIDKIDAHVRGLPVKTLELTMLASIAVMISVTTRVLGALPAFAFSVLPAMAALRIASNVPTALLLASLYGAFSGFAGYYCAFVWDLPVGASQAMVGVMLVGIAIVAEKVRAQ